VAHGAAVVGAAAVAVGADVRKVRVAAHQGLAARAGVRLRHPASGLLLVAGVDEGPVARRRAAVQAAAPAIGRLRASVEGPLRRPHQR
jgi:hypothetical protein